MDKKIKSSRRVAVSLTEDEYRQFYAYALVKGFGTNTGIASLARTAVIEKMARHGLTEAQQRKVDEIIGEMDLPRLAVLHSAPGGNLDEVRDSGKQA